jgi:hypothetical protein
MLYFDAVRPAISRLDETQCGVLLRSVMDYAQYGVVPELDPMTGLAFDMLVPKIDRDAERYEETREQRQYAAYAREKKKTGESCLSFADWRLMRAGQSDHENIGPISPVNENNGPYPSATATAAAATSTTAATTTTASSSTSLSPSAAAAGEGYKGEGEVRRIFAQWLHALDEKDNILAMRLDGQLYALGYQTDKTTRRLSKRAHPR